MDPNPVIVKNAKPDGGLLLSCTNTYIKGSDVNILQKMPIFAWIWFKLNL
jgi:hypothetical protein